MQFLIFFWACVKPLLGEGGGFVKVENKAVDKLFFFVSFFLRISNFLHYKVY